MSGKTMTMKQIPQSPPEETSGRFDGVLLFASRTSLVLAASLCVYYVNSLQMFVNRMWAWLLMSPVYNSVYFETWFATFCYAVIIPLYPFAIHYIKYFDRYKVHPSVTYEHTTVFDIAKEACMYMAPLMLLDTFTVKKYNGVSPNVWEEKRINVIQTTRGLPLDPPTVCQLVYQLVGSILLYDAFFFFIHFLMHKNIWLYKHVHSFHHKHDVMHPHVTNQLTVIERISLILSANFALKCLFSHPITRTVFIPVFIFMLVDNHTGYDLPFGLHRVVPFGIMGGPRAHYAHHVYGMRHYQPFLTYLDKLVIKAKLAH